MRRSRGSDDWVEFALEPGQIEYNNNRQFAHARTAYQDGPPDHCRHLIRMWSRDDSDLHIDG